MKIAFVFLLFVTSTYSAKYKIEYAIGDSITDIRLTLVDNPTNSESLVFVGSKVEYNDGISKQAQIDGDSDMDDEAGISDDSLTVANLKVTSYITKQVENTDADGQGGEHEEIQIPQYTVIYRKFETQHEEDLSIESTYTFSVTSSMLNNIRLKLGETTVSSTKSAMESETEGNQSDELDLDNVESIRWGLNNDAFSLEINVGDAANQSDNLIIL